MTTTRAQLEKTQHWLTLKGSMVPFIIGYALPAWTVEVKRRYRDFVVIDTIAMYARAGGSEAVFGVDEDRYRRVAQALLERPNNLARIFEVFGREERAFYTAGALAERASDFAAAFEGVRQAYVDVYCSGMPIDGFLVYGDEYVRQMREKYPSAAREIAVLVQPYGQTFTQRERQHLLELAAAGRADKLPAHRAAYHWIHNSYKDAQGLPEAYFREQYEQLRRREAGELRAEVVQLRTQAARQAAACEEIRRRGVFEPRDFARLLWLGKVAWWMDRRKACNLLGNYYIYRYARLLARRLKRAMADVLWLMPEEAQALAAGRRVWADLALPERRQEMALIYRGPRDYTVLLGRAAREVRGVVDPAVAASSADVRGQAASPGVGRGRVRVVFDPHRQRGFAAGDVLVAPMTRPDFVPLMKKAAAVVTDEGGITCHAAIMSREMNKPCVIGTKIATKVLRDGDLVEVDAEAGVVRKAE